jgi:hypothetical protein
LPRGTLPGIGLGLLAVAVCVAVMFQGRILRSRSDAELAQATLKDFADALERYRSRHGRLPGDVNRDGEIDAGETGYVASHLARAGLIRNGATELIVIIAGRPVDLRAIARRASAVPNAPRGRNLIEIWNLPCQVAQDLDSRIDDGNFARGNLRASVEACEVGGINDPVQVLALPLP